MRRERFHSSIERPLVFEANSGQASAGFPLPGAGIGTVSPERRSFCAIAAFAQ